MTDADSTKRCTKCGEVKPISEYHRRSLSKDGLSSRCKLCANSDNSARTAANPEKNRARALAWQAANKERRAEIRAKYRENNRDKVRAGQKAWKKANPEKVLADNAARMRANPEKRSAREAVRRARKLGVGGIHTPEQIAELYEKQKGRCAICNVKTGKKFHRDHIMPLVLGGTNDIGNIQLLCPSCNCRKGAKHPIDHAKQLGRLL